MRKVSNSQQVITDDQFHRFRHAHLRDGRGIQSLDHGHHVPSFADANTAAPASSFSASINWGDGTKSPNANIVSVGGGSFHVTGNHAYVTPSAYTITTTITDSAGGSITAPTGTATIGIVEAQEYDAVLSISLPDAVTISPPSAYTASISWGDGTANSTAVATPCTPIRVALSAAPCS